MSVVTLPSHTTNKTPLSAPLSRCTCPSFSRSRNIPHGMNPHQNGRHDATRRFKAHYEHCHGMEPKGTNHIKASSTIPVIARYRDGTDRQCGSVLNRLVPARAETSLGKHGRNHIESRALHSKMFKATPAPLNSHAKAPYAAAAAVKWYTAATILRGIVSFHLPVQGYFKDTTASPLERYFLFIACPTKTSSTAHY